MGNAVGYLDLDISKFQSALKQAQADAESTTKSMASTVGTNLTSAGKAISSAGATMTKNFSVPILAAGGACVKLSADFESSMSKVKALSGATGKDFDSLKGKALEMGAKTKYSASEAAQGFQYMALAGWNTEEMLEGIEPVLKLAGAAETDLGTTSDIVTDSLTALGLSAKDTSKFTDVLATTMKSSNTDVTQMGEAFKYAGPLAGALGYSVEDLGLALGTMANAGIKASQGGTSLRRLLMNMASPTDQVQAAMDKLGISMFNVDGTAKPLRQVLNDLRSSFSNLTEEEKSQYAATLAGATGMSGLLSIVNASEDSWNDLANAVDNATGATDDMYNEMQNNLSGQLTILKSSLQSLAISLGDLMLPLVKNLIAAIQNVVTWLNNLSDSQKQTIIRIAGIVAAIGPLLLIVGKTITMVGSLFNAFSTISTVTTSLKAGFTAIGTMVANVGEGFKLAKAGLTALGAEASPVGAALAGITAPVLAVVAAVVTLIAAFKTLWKTNEQFRSKIQEIWGGVVDNFKQATSKIVSAINSLGFNFKDIIDVIKTAWQALCNFLGPVIIAAIKTVASVINGIVNVVSGVIQTIIGIIKGFKDGDWSIFLDGLKTIFNGFIQLLLAPFSGLFESFKSTLQLFGTTWESIWNGIVNFFTGLWSGIQGVFANIWNGMKKIVSDAWQNISNLVKVGILLIKSILNAAIQIITLPFRLIWENCKGIIVNVWNAMSSKISNFLNTIKNKISTVWNAVKTIFVTVWNAISTVISTVWASIKAKIDSVLENIKTTINTAWNAVKTVTNTVFTAIQNLIVPIWDNIKSTVSNAVTNIKSTISSGFNSVKSTVSSILSGIKSTFTTTFNGIKSYMSGIVNYLKGLFNFKWNLPKLKLPHFKVSGTFSLNPPSVPSFNVEWYKKAMGNGMILNSASIFGYDSKTGKLLGGGEAGSETVVGTQSLMSMISDTVMKAMMSIIQQLSSSGEVANAAAGDIIIPVYIGNERIDTIVVKAIDRNNYRSGGR